MNTPKEVKFVATLHELLDATTNEDPTLTVAALVQLPPTPQLQERFAFTICGPEARELAGLVTTYVENLYAAIAAKKQSN